MSPTSDHKVEFLLSDAIQKFVSFNHLSTRPRWSHKNDALHTPGSKKPNHGRPPAGWGLIGSTFKPPYFQWNAVVLSSKSGKSVVWFLLFQPISFPARVVKHIIRALPMPDTSSGLTLFDWRGRDTSSACSVKGQGQLGEVEQCALWPYFKPPNCEVVGKC